MTVGLWFILLAAATITSVLFQNFDEAGAIRSLFSERPVAERGKVTKEGDVLGAFLRPKGRRSRLTYWRAAALIPLLAIVALVVATIALRVLFRKLAVLHIGAALYSTYAILSGCLVAGIFVVALWSGLAVAIQRLHDRDRSGWWVLIALVPVVGSLWYLFWNGLRPGTAGANRFGSDPRPSNEAIAAVFDEASGPRNARKPIKRKPIVSTIVAWALLLAILALDGFMLFQNPARRLPRAPATPTEPIER